MAVGAVVVHQLPGRVRLRVPARRGDHDYFSRVSEACSHIDVVRHVKANPRTGSIVIDFVDTIERLLALLRDIDLVITPQPSGDDNGPGLDRPGLDRPASTAIAADAGRYALNLVSGRNINPMFMIGTAFAVIGLVQAFRGKILAPSVTVFWYALDAFRRSQEDDT